MPRLFGLGKPKSPPVGGDIACLGLADWWFGSLTETERTKIRRAFKPMGASPGFAIDKGFTTCEGQRASKLLGAVAGWLRKDPALELKILHESERRATYVLDQHFVFSHLVEYWYRLRDKQPEARGYAIHYCQRQIAISHEAAKEYRKGDRDQNAQFKKYGVKPPKFDGRMPSHVGFKQLAIIYEKDGHFADAIQLCKQAKQDGWSGDWEQRIARLEGKRAKAG